MKIKTKKVLAFGTFDLLHLGHLHYLNEAKKLGSHLTVIVARDENVEKFKKKKPVHKEGFRLEIVGSLKAVDNAVLGCREDIFEKVVELNPDVIALGYDQIPGEPEVKAEIKRRNLKCRVITVSAFKEAEQKSSLIKSKIRNEC
ncbi:MAG TPA: adenylyltransferase/cytidyltransferase family protein [archaeon]|nr:adenylyltransferase/cytidyltransferase family protein [archaeon]